MEAVMAVCVCVMTVLSCIRFVWWVSAIAQSRRDARYKGWRNLYTLIRRVGQGRFRALVLRGAL